MANNTDMDVSMLSALAGLATNMVNEQVQSQLGVAILKQTLDQEKQQGAALVNMIQATPRPAASNHLVDLYA